MPEEVFPEDRFFFLPLMTAEQYPDVDIRYLGYWSADLRLPTGELHWENTRNGN